VNPIFAPNSFFPPPLSPATVSFIRMSYGILLLGTLLLALPHWHRFFRSERWRGYAQSQRDVDLAHNPIVSWIVAIIWFAAAAAITFGRFTIAATLINLLFCRYFFVRMRWKGVLRGMGAPGFMSYWLAAVVFLIELARGGSAGLQSLVLLVAQVDFAFIMLSAGIYKLTAGYAHNHGMEGGMVNPQWGYWWWIYQRISPTHWIFKVLNHLAWSLEVIAGVLMLIPQTRFVGGLIILSSFIFIATQIRLGLLCEMVIVCCFIFFYPGSYGDQLLIWITPAQFVSNAPGLLLPLPLQNILAFLLWTYLVLLPLAHAGLFLNFYANRSLPGSVQRLLESYTNFFGIIIWRVFSADHTNFFVRIYQRSAPNDGEGRQLVSRLGLRGGLRYNHVAEAIVLTTLFTTLKYYPSNNEIFRERLLRYARTVPGADRGVLEFEYVRIARRAKGFELVPVAEYIVDTAGASVTERSLDEDFSVRTALSISPVREGIRPGSYLPMKS
jgi:hypothetical protein